MVAGVVVFGVLWSMKYRRSNNKKLATFTETQRRNAMDNYNTYLIAMAVPSNHFKKIYDHEAEGGIDIL